MATTQSLSDILSGRLQANNQVTTNNAGVNAGLAGNYYSGTQTYATQDPAARLAQTGNSQTVLSGQVSDIMAGKIQDAQIAKQKAAAAALLKQQQAANAAAGKASFNISYSKGLTSSQRAALQAAANNNSSALYAGGSNSAGSGTYHITGGRGNTSGAAGAQGGSVGSGTYKYVYNSKLDAQRNAALALATSYIGTPYVLGGESHTSMDCSGLVQLVYQTMGFKVPTHSSADQGQTGGRSNGNGIPGVKTSVYNLQPGDLIAWKDGSHIAIYAGRNAAGQIQIIESANPTRGTLTRTLWASSSAVVGLHVTFPGEGSATSAKTNAIASKQAQLR